MVVLDTNIIIDYLRQRGLNRETTLERLIAAQGSKNLAISVLTVQELYEGKSVAQEEEEKAVQLAVSKLRVLPYSYDTAKLAGEIARQRKYPLEFADAAIAATTIVNDAELATLNPKDFAGIRDLVIFPTTP